MGRRCTSSATDAVRALRSRCGLPGRWTSRASRSRPCCARWVTAFAIADVRAGWRSERLRLCRSCRQAHLRAFCRRRAAFLRPNPSRRRDRFGAAPRCRDGRRCRSRRRTRSRRYCDVAVTRSRASTNWMPAARNSGIIARTAASVVGRGWPMAIALPLRCAMAAAARSCASVYATVA